MINSSDVIILFGGASSERMVSVASAQHVSSIIPQATLWFWSADGKVLDVVSEELSRHDQPFIKEFVPSKGRKIAECIEDAIKLIKGQTVYLALHGGDGENGWLQERLERHGVCFTGSSAESSSNAMDKIKAKEKVRVRGVLTAAQHVFHVNAAGALAGLKTFMESVGSLVVKPASDGSSAGLAFLETKTDCDAWFANNRDSPLQWLAEERLIGRELTVGVMSQYGCLMALPPSEVILDRGSHFDYQGKYLGVGNREVTPAELSVAQAAAAQAVAVLAHDALGCFGYTRTDMIMTAKGFYYLETNTLPGMTKASFIPQQLRAAEIGIDDFVAGQIRLAKLRFKI
jgi:D-alanine-D-alanine ligase